MTDKKPSSGAGRPPAGEDRGRPLTIYLTKTREELFEAAFKLLRDKKRLPITATLGRSRVDIIDYALEALLEKLREEKS